MEKFDPEKRIECKWAWDSESGEKLLIDMISGQVLTRGKDLKGMAFPSKETRLIEDAKMWQQGFDEGYERAKADDDWMLADMSDRIACLKDERDYLLRLSNPNGDGLIQ